MQRILVINPNSNESVTEGLRSALAGFADRVIIDCRTLVDGPFGIESDEDVLAASRLVVAEIESSTSYDAYITGCYSDPGLAESCRRFDIPVFGFQRSALETAAALGGRFGVLALSDESIARHIPYISSPGYGDHLAGELPLDISVDESANDPATLGKVVDTGQRLIDEYGANSLILGCAGMAAVRDLAQKELPVPVIEPARAAVRLAIESAD